MSALRILASVYPKLSFPSPQAQFIKGIVLKIRPQKILIFIQPSPYFYTFSMFLYHYVQVCQTPIPSRADVFSIILNWTIVYRASLWMSSRCILYNRFCTCIRKSSVEHCSIKAVSNKLVRWCAAFVASILRTKLVQESWISVPFIFIPWTVAISYIRQC